jgi:CheY-like chemotaxis protein
VLKRRLEKSGHTVCVAVDGQECFDVYAADVHRFDVVLMDLQVSSSNLRLLYLDFLYSANSKLPLPQMPLMDGSTSARMIRQLERKLANGSSHWRRIPIFAVSASLVENLRFAYIEDG